MKTLKIIGQTVIMGGLLITYATFIFVDYPQMNLAVINWSFWLRPLIPAIAVATIMWLIFYGVQHYTRTIIEEQNGQLEKTMKEQNIKIANILNDHRQKLSALKTFRDQEQVRLADHINAQIKQLDDRLSLLDKVEYREPNPSDLKNAAESKRLKDIEINNYNNAFKDWGIGNYGHADQTTLYKTNDYKIN